MTTQPLEHNRRPLAAALAASMMLADAAAAFSASGFPQPHPAATWTVTNCADSGPGSLREAFAAALDNDVIDLTQLTCSTITLTSGALVSPAPGFIAVRGPYLVDGQPSLTIDGGHAGRVFLKDSGNLGLYRMAITGGAYHGAAGGGCVHVQNAVRIDDSVVSDCTVSTTGTTDAYGGAVFAGGGVYLSRTTIRASTAHAASADSGGGAIRAGGMVFLENSTISGNSATGDGSHYARGGGVFTLHSFNITDSTISGNRADTGAGAFIAGNGSHRILVDNSTISGNQALGAGGGLLVTTPALSLSIRSSTITANSATFDFGAGVYLAGAVTLDGSIIANNTTQYGLHLSDIHGSAGTTISGANNLVLASTLNLPADTITLDPLLGPLQNNGGTTLTHALLRGSPAINRGSNVSMHSSDQRLNDGHGHYFDRVVYGVPDIGAFEYGADFIFADSFEPPD